MLKRHKNVVMIMCDSLQWHYMGCYGGKVKTPNFDRLAQRYPGLSFTIERVETLDMDQVKARILEAISK